MKAFFKKTAGALGILCLLVFGARALTAPRAVEAGSNTIHPQVCLGGWKDSALAEGQGSVPKGGGTDAYSKENSAWLEAGSAATLYCGSFAFVAREQPPSGARLTLQGAVTQPPAPNVPPQEPSLEGTTVVEPQGSSEPVEVPALLPEPEPAVEQEPKDEPAPEPAPVQEPEPTSWFSIPVAHAQGAADELFSVSYTIDGAQWHGLGTLGQGQWDDFSSTIPVSSWEDLAHLQVKIEAAHALDERGAAYLDAMSLVIEEDISILESAMDVAGGVGESVASVFNAVEGLADMALEALGITPPPPPPVVVLAPAPAPAAPPAPVTKLSFELDGLPISAERVLPWFDDKYKALAARESGSLQSPRVVISNDGLSITVEGQCAKKYFAVLTFREADDYKLRPQTFASNYAAPCTGGAFSYDMGALPLDTKDSRYYLLVAGQDDTGPWMPASTLLPIRVKHKEVLPTPTP